jgi:hypothetical protein
MHPLRPVENPLPNTWFDRLAVLAVVVLSLAGVFVAVVALFTVPRLAPASGVPGVHKLAAWFYLAAHSISLHLVIGSEQFAYPIRAIPGWHDGLRLLPPIGLFVGGYAIARRSFLPNELRGAIEGAKLTVLYLPFTIVVGLLSTHTRRLPTSMLPPEAVENLTASASLHVTPDHLGVTVVAGVLYPVVFAGLGGAVASEVASLLDRRHSGLLHRLDCFFQRIDDRGPEPSAVGEIDTDATSSLIAGIAIAVAQVPGFLVTYGVFRHNQKLNVGPFFEASLFPAGGIGLFLAIAFVGGTLAWWYLADREFAQTTEGGFSLGWAVGAVCHVAFWTIGFAASGLSDPAVPWLFEVVSLVVLTYTVGFLQSFGAAAVVALLVGRRLRTNVFVRHFYS